jgi:hypothetical protein
LCIAKRQPKTGDSWKKPSKLPRSITSLGFSEPSRKGSHSATVTAPDGSGSSDAFLMGHEVPWARGPQTFSQRFTRRCTRSLVCFGSSMDNEPGENGTPQEFARTIHDEVQIARDTALKAHQLFVHSDHAAATGFMHHADQLNHVLAGLNRMSEKSTDR